MPDKLYHPVKPPQFLESWPQRVRRAAVWVKQLGEQIVFVNEG
ncbi:MAG: hypothetical protein ABJC63_09470 [Gemmatimonadales bacterium]